MKPDKLVEAIVTANTTIGMQLEAFSKNTTNPEAVAIDLSVPLFGLPDKERTFAELEKELTMLLVKKLGVLGIMKAMGKGLFSRSGPLQGMQKVLIADACRKMGMVIPVKTL
ncbi:MAG: hypothetical protein JXO48_02635 [Deltaproteobacteria bacterium]|nr:hypothetical protein [Deltaproteobacteria bacterium]